MKHDEGAEQAAGPVMAGPVVDEQTRCRLHGGPTDVVAMRFRCCGLHRHLPFAG